MSAELDHARYLFDNGSAGELERLQSLEATWDPGTIAVLDELGVAPGWSCLDVGAGAGSIARWLVGRVGPAGRVVASDLDVHLLETVAPPPVEVWRHDVVSDPLPEAGFDLVHARSLLQHLPDRDAVVHRLAAAVRPGGWLVVEDTEWSTLLATDPPRPEFVAIERALRAVMTTAGFDPRCGLGHRARLRHAGLVDVAARRRVVTMRGGGLGSAWFRLWITRLRPQLEATGLAPGVVDAVLAAMADPHVDWTSQTMIATWGRRGDDAARPSPGARGWRA